MLTISKPEVGQEWAYICEGLPPQWKCTELVIYRQQKLREGEMICITRNDYHRGNIDKRRDCIKPSPHHWGMGSPYSAFWVPRRLQPKRASIRSAVFCTDRPLDRLQPVSSITIVCPTSRSCIWHGYIIFIVAKKANSFRPNVKQWQVEFVSHIFFHNLLKIKHVGFQSLNVS